MKEYLEIIVDGMFGLYFIIIPMIMLKRIHYFKTLRNKRYNGVADLFNVFCEEWWISGVMLGLPIIGKDDKQQLNEIRRKSNKRLYFFYGIFATQIIIIALL